MASPTSASASASGLPASMAISAASSSRRRRRQVGGPQQDGRPLDDGRRPHDAKAPTAAAIAWLDCDGGPAPGGRPSGRSGPGRPSRASPAVRTACPAMTSGTSKPSVGSTDVDGRGQPAPGPAPAAARPAARCGTRWSGHGARDGGRWGRPGGRAGGRAAMPPGGRGPGEPGGVADRRLEVRAPEHALAPRTSRWRCSPAGGGRGSSCPG